VPNFVKIGRSFAEILRFLEFSRWPPPPSCIFEIAKFYWLLESRGSRCISMPNFCQNRSISCEDKIFPFFKMAAVRHLGFVWGIFGLPTVSIWGLYHSAKFGYDRCSSFYKPPAHRCPRQRRQRQRVTDGTARAPWNGPKKVCVQKSL